MSVGRLDGSSTAAGSPRLRGFAGRASGAPAGADGAEPHSACPESQAGTSGTLRPEDPDD